MLPIHFNYLHFKIVFLKNKVISLFVYIIAVLLFLELILRFCFPIPELKNFNRAIYQVQAHDPSIPNYLRNIKMTWQSSLDTNHVFEHELNTYGYRDNKEWSQTKSKRRILFLGDSFVEGMMSTQDKTMLSTFEDLAVTDGFDLECWNAGMMGIGFNEYLKFLRDFIPLFKPDEIFLVLFANDAPFQRAYLPGQKIKAKNYNVFTPRILVLIEEIKRDNPIPFRFFKEKRPFFKAVPDQGNPWTFHSEKLEKEVSPKIAAAMKKGEMNAFRVNWILEEEKFLKAPIQVEDKLSYLKALSTKYGCKLSLFYIPSRSQVSNYYYQFERQACLLKCPDFIDLTGPEYHQHAKQLELDCQKLNLPFYNFTSIVEREEKNGNHLYWNYDDHMRAKGYQLMGRAIYNTWNSNQ